ncbi:MAG: hypothetical protein IJI21_03135 [Clostridia bacterium]|nr:hypothetical protein [Clostridia bacterium]
MKEQVLHHEGTVEALNGIRLSGCEGIRVGDVLYHRIRLRERDIHTGRALLGRFFSKLLRDLFFADEVFDRAGDGDTLFCFARYYLFRKGLRENFERVVSLSDHHVYLHPGKKRFTLSRLKHLGKLFTWTREMKAAPGMTLPQRLYYAGYLFECEARYAAMKAYERKAGLRFNRMLVLNDVQYLDSWFVQHFNREGRDTVTLQHGVYCATLDVWTYTGSHSRTLLANSRFTVDEAKIIGFDHEMKVVGLFTFIHNQPEPRELPAAIGTVGAFLDDDNLLRDNFRMIEVLRDFCASRKKKLKVRMHPTSHAERYEQFRQDPCVEFVPREQPLFDFFREIDVAVVRNTTVLLEATQFGLPVYIIRNEEQLYDVYQNEPALKFGTTEEFAALVERPAEEIRKDAEAAREIYGCPGDIAENYRRAFAELGIR